MKITHFAVHRPVFTVMVVLTVLILGGVSLSRLPVDLMPDILANSGGVIASYMEWRQARSGAMGRAEETLNTIAERLDAAFHGVIATASERQVTYRMAAQIAAVGELIATMRDRGWIPPQ